MVSIPKEFPSLESSGLIGMLRAVQLVPALMLCLECIPHPVSPWLILAPGRNLCLSQPVWLPLCSSQSRLRG